MKKLIVLFLAATLFTLNARSRITKGNWMVGGDASFIVAEGVYSRTYLFGSLFEPEI